MNSKNNKNAVRACVCHFFLLSLQRIFKTSIL